MLIVALVLAVIGLAALVFAVVTSNELVAWVCIAASVVGVLLLIIDSVRERQQRQAGTESVGKDQRAPQEVSSAGDTGTQEVAQPDYPQDAADEGEGGVGEQLPVRSADSGSEEESGA
jgi:hypothetical protein